LISRANNLCKQGVVVAGSIPATSTNFFIFSELVADVAFASELALHDGLIACVIL
jgi:hypothetical protein